MKSIITLIIASSLFAAIAIAQPRYSVTDLGPVGVPPGQPYLISNNGLATGAAAIAGGAMHAVLWYRGLKIDIGKPGIGGPNSAAFGVNERGQAVGHKAKALPICKRAKDPIGSLKTIPR